MPAAVTLSKEVISNPLKYRTGAEVVAAFRTRYALSTTSSQLSLIRKTLEVNDGLGSLPMAKRRAWLDGLKLTPVDHDALKQAAAVKLRSAGMNLPEVNGDQIIRDARELLASADPCEVLVGLAALTGRRTAELVVTGRFRPPEDPSHRTNERFWASFSGQLKVREGEPEPVYDIPLLVERSQVLAALAVVRAAFPGLAVAEVNGKVGKPVSRMMGELAAHIGTIHRFRRFYALACYRYFNQNGCSLPVLATQYLGHKDVDQSILTYLNIRVANLGSLDFGGPDGSGGGDLRVIVDTT